MARYRFPEQLRFRHLKVGELFRFPANAAHPFALGPFVKLSARKYQPCEVWVTGGLRVKHSVTGAPILIGSINAAVSDRVID